MPSPYDYDDNDNLIPDFWQGVNEGQFRIQRCDSCSWSRFPPTTFCPKCHGLAFHWEAISGQAAVWTFTIVYRSPTEAVAREVPYALVVGKLIEGPLVLGALHHILPSAVEIGLPISLRVYEAEDGVARYHFVSASVGDEAADHIGPTFDE